MVAAVSGVISGASADGGGGGRRHEGHLASESEHKIQRVEEREKNTWSHYMVVVLNEWSTVQIGVLPYV